MLGLKHKPPVVSTFKSTFIYVTQAKVTAATEQMKGTSLSLYLVKRTVGTSNVSNRDRIYTRRAHVCVVTVKHKKQSCHTVFTCYCLDDLKASLKLN